MELKLNATKSFGQIFHLKSIQWKNMCRLKSIWARDLKFPGESRGPSNLRIPEKSIQLGSSTKIECYQWFLTRFQAKTPSSQMFLTYRRHIFKRRNRPRSTEFSSAHFHLWRLGSLDSLYLQRRFYADRQIRLKNLWVVINEFMKSNTIESVLFLISGLQCIEKGLQTHKI